MAKSDILVRWKADTSNYDANIAKAKRTLNNFKQDNLSMGGVLAQGARSFTAYASSVMSATAAIGALTSAIASNVQTALQFEKSMSVLSSLTGKTGEDLATLKEYAIQLGGSTTLTASQVADAFRMIGSQQPQLLSSSEALRDVTREAIRLSEAAGIELATAAQTLSTSINQMGGDSSNATRYVNVLAAASQKGAGDIAWLGESITKAATAAKAVGTDYEELVANLEMLAKGGFDASTAGTALRSIIMNLEKQANNEFKPSIVGLTTAFENMGKAELTITDYQAIAGKMFASQAKVLADNAAEARNLTEAITGTSIAEEQAAINVDNLDGALKGLSSAWEALNLHINSSNGLLTDAVRATTQMVRAVDSLVSGATSLSEKLSNVGWIASKLSNMPVVKMLGFGVFTAGGYISSRNGQRGAGADAGALLSGIRPVSFTEGSGPAASKPTPEIDDTTDAGIKASIKRLKKERDALARDSQEYANLTNEITRLQALIQTPKSPRISSRTEKLMEGGIKSTRGFDGLIDATVGTYESMASLRQRLSDYEKARANATNIVDEMNARQGIADTKWALSDVGRQAVKLGLDKSAFEELQEEINEGIGKMELKPLVIDPVSEEDMAKSRALAKEGNDTAKAWQNAASAVGSVGSALQSIEDPGAQVAGIVMQAIANIALGFSKQSIEAAGGGPFAWIAATLSGLAVMTSTIAQIKSATKGGFASGGIVPGNSFSGDNLRTSDYGINSGELILNRAQQGNLAQQLSDGGGGGGMRPSWISGEQIYVAMNRYTRRTGRGEIVTWK